MIKLPYFNSGVIDLLPNPSVATQGDGYIIGADDEKCQLPLDGYNKVYISFEGKCTYSYSYFPYFKFSNSKFTFGNSSVDGESISPYNNSNWYRFDCVIEETSEGCNIEVKTSDYTITKTIAGARLLSFVLNKGWHFRNIYISTTDEKIPYYLTSKVMSIDSIEGWRLNDSGEYVLTEVDSQGVIHLNSEVLETILRDYDIIGCAVSFNTEKRGENLKSIEFTSDGVSSIGEISHGLDYNYIPITFNNPSNLSNTTLTVRG